MGKYVLARQLSGKKVITNEGEEFGRLVDMDIDELSGKIEQLVLEPNPDHPLTEKVRKEEGMAIIPYSSVLAIGDFIIVEKKSILSD